MSEMGKQMITVGYIQGRNCNRELTREELVKISPALLADVESVNAEPTNRLLPDNDDRVEFSQQVRFQMEDPDTDAGDEWPTALCRAIFFQSRSEVETREDLSDLQWIPDHFEIVY